MIGVVAMNRDRCIGRDGRIPWHHREDLAFFKRLTTGGTVIMGRKTWDSLPRKPLPKRDNVVLTRSPGDPGLLRDGARFTGPETLDAVLKGLRQPWFVIGGREVYDLLWDRIEEFHVTWVEDEVEGGDTFFPRDLEAEFGEVERTVLSDSCTVVHLRRRGGRSRPAI